MIRVSGLFIYPVKGCRGLCVPSAQLDALGLAGDRRFLIVDESGKFVSQRTVPRLITIDTALTATALRLDNPVFGAIEVPLGSDASAPKLRPVEVWNDRGLVAEDCGEAVASWLSSVVRVRVSLVRIGPAFLRPIKNHPTENVSFADAYPLLVVSQASLDDLNDHLVAAGEEPVPMNRFRPNLVVEGCSPYAEDTWKGVQIGSTRLRPGGACIRCIVTTTDQSTGVRGKEPLKTLATYRLAPSGESGVIFGQNYIHETKRGEIRVGDFVSTIL